MLDTWSRLTRDMFQTLRTVSSQLETILPQGRNVGTLAYAGIVLAITIDVLLRALTIPVAVLAGLAFVPRRVLPEFAGRFLGWFALWQLPLLLMFMTFALFLDWRYAMGIALLAGMPAVFTLEAIASDAWAGSWRHKVLLVAAVAAVAIPFGLAVPRLSNLAYVRDAGIWVRDSLPPNAMVLTNDARIAYYSGRTYQQQVKAVPFFRLKDNLADANYLALHVERGTPPTIDGVDQSKPVATLHGTGERQVIVYHLR